MISEPETQAAQLRALDVIAEQRRRISELRAVVLPAKHRILDAAGALAWRSPSRPEFEIRVAELGDRLVIATLHLADALDQCERARRAVLAGFADDEGVRSSPTGHPGYPAAAPSTGAAQAP